MKNIHIIFEIKSCDMICPNCQGAIRVELCKSSSTNLSWDPLSWCEKSWGVLVGGFNSIFETTTWVFPKIVVPQNRWFIRENPIRLDDLGVPQLFGNIHLGKVVVTSSYTTCIVTIAPVSSSILYQFCWVKSLLILQGFRRRQRVADFGKKSNGDGKTHWTRQGRDSNR